MSHICSKLFSISYAPPIDNVVILKQVLTSFCCDPCKWEVYMVSGLPLTSTVVVAARILL
jgi:hypothetical protein